MIVTSDAIKALLEEMKDKKSTRWMIETYMQLAPAEISLPMNINDDLDKLSREYCSEIEKELDYEKYCNYSEE